MARPLLPPRGVHVPARMIYNPQLPPAVILTWIQLRGLAWGGTVMPPLCMQELAVSPARVRRRFTVTCPFSDICSPFRTSSYFPRISELRQAAQQLAGTIYFSSLPSPGADYLSLEAFQLEKDYFQHAKFDRKKWEKLANQFERIDRQYRDTELREKARHIQESKSAHQRGEDYPSREERQRYAERNTYPGINQTGRAAQETVITQSSSGKAA